ncbi:MAG TPA: hypothetical protein VK826_04120 [Bacteroidia bacterium]|nr:hypothetical protein [Bacteroidia bacterium]
MKLIAVALFIVAACTSCSSFHQLHYRHVKKVPATPVVFAAMPHSHSSHASPDISADSVGENKEPVVATNLVCESADTMVVATSDSVAFFTEAFAQKLETVKSWRGAVINFQRQQRRDWSLAWAALFIVTGLLLLLYVIFMLSARGPMLLGRILLSIAITFAALTLLIRGFGMFFNRFRRSKTYKEE